MTRPLLAAFVLSLAGCAAPAGGPASGAPAPTSDVTPLMGVAVCDALRDGLLADSYGTDGGPDIRDYATAVVLDELYENNPFDVPGVDEDEIVTWSDSDQNCAMSAGGDAYFLLFLQPRPDGAGQWATGIDIEVSTG